MVTSTASKLLEIHQFMNTPRISRWIVCFSFYRFRVPILGSHLLHFASHVASSALTDLTSTTPLKRTPQNGQGQGLLGSDSPAGVGNNARPLLLWSNSNGFCAGPARLYCLRQSRAGSIPDTFTTRRGLRRPITTPPSQRTLIWC